MEVDTISFDGHQIVSFVSFYATLKMSECAILKCEIDFVEITEPPNSMLWIQVEMMQKFPQNPLSTPTSHLNTATNPQLLSITV